MLRLILLRFLESYFRHRWLYLLPIVLMMVFAGVSETQSVPVYIAYGNLYVQKQSFLAALTAERDSGFSWVTPSQTTNNELRELFQTEAFVRSAISRTDLEANMSKGPESVRTTIELFRRSVWVQSLGDNLLEVGAKHEDPHIAQQLASATMGAYVQWKINADRQESVVAQDFFTNLILPYQKELDQARDQMKNYLAANPDPVRGDRPTEEQIQINLLQSAIDLAAKRVENALNKEESARLALSQAESNARQTYIMVDEPTTPPESATSLKNIAKSMAIFLVIGIVLSVGGIGGGALLDRSLRFPLDVRHGLDLPVLAMIPDVPAVAVLPVAADTALPVASDTILPVTSDTALPVASDTGEKATDGLPDHSAGESEHERQDSAEAEHSELPALPA